MIKVYSLIKPYWALWVAWLSITTDQTFAFDLYIRFVSFSLKVLQGGCEIRYDGLCLDRAFLVGCLRYNNLGSA